MPQQQTIRDALEAGGDAHVLLPGKSAPGPCADRLPSRGWVITDSQAFAQVSKLVPDSVPLTSFSILMARYKGDLPLAVAGAAAVNALKDGDKVLIARAAPTIASVRDIGTVKLPKWIRQYTGVEPEFHFTSGTEFPESLAGYRRWCTAAPACSTSGKSATACTVPGPRGCL